MNITWHSNRRTDITFSLEGDDVFKPAAATYHAGDAAIKAIEKTGQGWTKRDGVGGWQGKREFSQTLTLVGDDHEDAAIAAIEALHEAGAIAVQVERWDEKGYNVREVRPDGNS
jgi:hypothetical protein